MQDENAQVAQEGINAGKKLLQGLEKNKKELENTAKNVTRPVANKAKNKAVSAAKETKAGKAVEKTVQNVTGSAKKAVKKMMKKMTAETKKMAKNAGVEAKAATEKAMVDAGNTVGSAAGVATLGVGTAASQGAAAAKKASIDTKKQREKAKNQAEATREGNSGNGSVIKAPKVTDIGKKLMKTADKGNDNVMALAKGAVQKAQETQQSRD